jgi:hypothetical protein
MLPALTTFDHVATSRAITRANPCQSVTVFQARLAHCCIAPACLVARGPKTGSLIRVGAASAERDGLGFLQTPHHDDALALLPVFGAFYTWHQEFRPTRSVPCLAHKIVDQPLHFVGSFYPAK